MNILIADDFYTNRLHLRIILRDLGYSYNEACNGEEAIEKFIKDHYDMILMDIEMPVRNGLETTRYIRNNFSGKKKDVVIVAITAHNPEDFFSDYAKAGFDGLISKPVTKEKLVKFISEKARKETP